MRKSLPLSPTLPLLHSPVAPKCSQRHHYFGFKKREKLSIVLLPKLQLAPKVLLSRKQCSPNIREREISGVTQKLFITHPERFSFYLLLVGAALEGYHWIPPKLSPGVFKSVHGGGILVLFGQWTNFFPHFHLL